MFKWLDDLRFKLTHKLRIVETTERSKEGVRVYYKVQLRELMEWYDAHGVVFNGVAPEGEWLSRDLNDCKLFIDSYLQLAREDWDNRTTTKIIKYP